MHLVPVQAESISPPFNGSFVIVLYQEQIALLVCTFTLPGYWSYKLIKLIPVLISVAVYILQPKPLSFNHSFSSISQPVLSPLQQLHPYNSQYPRNDLPEQPFPILPLVQTLFYGFLGYGHFFLCSEQKRKGSTKVLGMEIIRTGRREIILCITAAFTLKGSTCVCWLWCNFPGQSSPFQGSNRRGLWRCHASSPQGIRQYLSSSIALTFYWQSSRLFLAEVWVWIRVTPRSLMRLSSLAS